MGKNSKKNNSPEQKAQWKENQKLNRVSSDFATITDAKAYQHALKEPSKRDLHRMKSGYNKYK
mgnify:FL=1